MFRNSYVALWLLLALSLAIISILAFCGDVSLLGHPLKKATFSDLLTREVSTIDSVESLMANNTELTLQPDKNPTDSTSQTFLIFGDSMTFNLALRLAKYAKQNGHEIHSINWDSSNTKIWADHDTLAYYINKFHPTQIFICLGSNELYTKNPESRLPYINKILATIDTIPYIWIGPPNWKEDGGINDLLAKTCRPGSFFRSKGMEFKRRSDGIHPTKESSALWMDSIMRWIPKSSHPFVCDVPADTIKNASPNLIVLKALNK